MAGIDDKSYGREDSGEEMEDDRIFLSNLNPLIAYVTYENKTQLNIFSLVTEQTISSI